MNISFLSLKDIVSLYGAVINEAVSRVVNGGWYHTIGITIGEGSLIGAGSVVTKDVPPHTTWVGNPAK